MEATVLPLLKFTWALLASATALCSSAAGGQNTHWRYFSRFLRIYTDSPQIEVELYGGTLRQIFMLGSEYFSILKNYRSKLHRAKDWPTLVIYRQLKHSLLQQFVQATNFLLPPSHPQVCWLMNNPASPPWLEGQTLDKLQSSELGPNSRHKVRPGT